LIAHGIHGFEISGLTVTNGSGNEPGGGLFTGQPEKHSMGSVNGVVFVSNTGSLGGAIYVHGANLQITQSSFFGNAAVENGGAISVVNETAKLRITNSTFVDNKALNGGAIHVAAGNIVIEHVTVVRNEATAGTAGLFVADLIDVNNITSSIVHENLKKGTSSNSNRDQLPLSNVLTTEWEHSLLGQIGYNTFQDGRTTRSGPTPTIAILPQILFRLGSSTQRLTQASDPRLPASSTDQRGAPGASLGRSDAGALERQYFIDDKSMTRFFIVDDDQTGSQLWAEVVDRGDVKKWTPDTLVSRNQLVFAPDSELALLFECTNEGMGRTGTEPPTWPSIIGEVANETTGVVWKAIDAPTSYVQISQHVGSNPKIRTQPGDSFAVHPNAIEFEIDSQSLAATRSNSGLVQPSTLFPSSSLSVTSVTLNATSYIKLRLMDETLFYKSGLPNTTWTVHTRGQSLQSDGQIRNPQGVYRIELKSNDTTVEALEVEITKNGQ
jgi:hypothetical protein